MEGYIVTRLCRQSFRGNDRKKFRLLYHWLLPAAFSKILQVRDNLGRKWDGQKAKEEKYRYACFLKVRGMSLCLYKRPTLGPVFAS